MINSPLHEIFTIPLPETPRVILLGSVGSSERALQTLVQEGISPVAVAGLAPEAASQVSDFVDLSFIAHRERIPYLPFTKINSSECIEWFEQHQPDLLFVIGLSQLIGPDLLSIPTYGSIGFHPTQVPLGRGRAPIAWVTTQSVPGAASLFFINEGVDSGAVITQVPYSVSCRDTAQDVLSYACDALEVGIRQIADMIRKREIIALPQREENATYFGIRKPEDGLIQWNQSAEAIDMLIRASGPPHPGAFTYHAGSPIKILRSALEPIIPYQGMIGRVLTIDPRYGYLVQSGTTPLWVSDISFPEGMKKLKVGDKLGYVESLEIHSLREKVHTLEARIKVMERQLRLSRGECE